MTTPGRRSPAARGTMDPMGQRGGQERADTPGRALRRHPATLLFTSWPWRSLAYLATTPLVAAGWAVLCWPLLTLAGVPLGHVERRRLGLVDRGPAPDPHAPGGGGFRERVRSRSRERITWTELLHGALLLPLSLLDFAVVTAALLTPALLAASSGLLVVFALLGIDPATADPDTTALQRDPAAQAALCLLGLLLLGVGLYAVTLVAEGQRYLARVLVTEPDPALAARVDDLARSRTRVVSAFDEERRRIERDLHDGAQQRLTGLVITLGALRYQHARGGDIAPLIDRAGTIARQAVEELRETVHGIYPAALRDDDLADALDDLTAVARTAGLTTTVGLDLPSPVPSGVQVGVYFAVSELFTNIVKHARARSLSLDARQRPDGSLVVTVEDDGRGGARTDSGTGLLGVADRIAALGGHVTVTSPQGGPTRVVVEVPCAS